MSVEKEVHGDGRAIRIGRVLDEFLGRRERGESVSEADLLADHPDLAEELRQHLELLHDLPPVTDRIEALITRGLLTGSDDARYLAELGAYKIAGYIGRGGMGIVFKAYEESLRRTVALKILRPELAEDRIALGRFTREAQAAAALKHPNIVTVHAVGQERGIPFIAMEYVAGGSVADTIRAQGPLSAETARHIFRQLLEALAAAHGAGLIHRDVKSSNILVEEGLRDRGIEGSRDRGNEEPGQSDGPRPPLLCRRSVAEAALSAAEESLPCIKLADFGLARVLSSQTRVTSADSILGTPEYMSPEQARGEEDIDERSDLYSAGVVLYELLTGRTPFRADAPSAVIHQILHVEPAAPRTNDGEVDPLLVSVVLRLMAKEREGRFSSALDALDALDGKTRVSRPRRRRRVRERVRAVLLMLLVTSGGIGLGWRFGADVGQTDVASGESPSAPIVHVALAKDGRNVLVRRGNAAVLEVLDWPELADYQERWKEYAGPLYSAVRLVESAGQQLLAVSFAHFVDEDSSALVLFGLDGGIVRRLAFCQAYVWPDDDDPRECWIADPIDSAELDGKPGEELVVVAHHPTQYPTQIAVLDPASGQLLGRCWHMGRLNVLNAIADVLAGGMPGIVAGGVNNKLGGFRVPQPSDPQPMVDFRDKVPIVMILDPDDMDDPGPPRPRQVVAVSPKLPYAYAILDVSAAVRLDRASGDPGAGHEIARAEIADITPAGDSSRPGDVRTARLRVTIWFETKRGVANPTLVVDRDLNLLDVEIADQDRPLTNRAYWEARWHPIIQHGEYVGR